MKLKKRPGQRWIEVGSPNRPVSTVACRALKQRFGTVLYFLPLAAEKARESDEYVHQVRVATRRSVAVLCIFAGLMPQRRSKKLQKQLRRLRRAAGEARDLDVLGHRLAKKGQDKQLTADLIAQRRQAAQAPLVDEYARLRKCKFAKRIKQLIQCVDWYAKCAEPEFGDFARSALRPSVEEFFTAARGDLSDIHTLHELRIAGKQLRYAMEIFAGAFDNSFRGELYPTFEKVQDKLGAINDHATAHAMFEKWLEESTEKALARQLHELLDEERRSIDATVQEFKDWWTDKRAAKLLGHFEEFLGQLGPWPTADAAGEPENGTPPVNGTSTEESAESPSFA